VLDVADLIANILRGAWDILVGVFTGDWSRALAGLLEIIGGSFAFFLQILSIATLGTLVGTFVGSANAWKLRNYARGLLQEKYGTKDPEGFRKMVEALGLDSGGFGLRLKVKALRTFVRSDFHSQPDGPPDLYVWVHDNHLNLKVLAGFNPPQAWWERPWPELVGDSGDIEDSDIDTYTIKKGVGDQVKHFSLFCMSKDDMQTRLDCAEQHAPEIGLILQTSIEDKCLEHFDEITISRPAVPSILEEKPFLRHNRADDTAVATSELCQPGAIGVFGFTEETAMGQSAHLADCTCLEAQPSSTTTTTAFPGQGITGTTFRNAKPDLIFKYTAIHELGHTFGLCHVDNLLRIMYTRAESEKKSWATWGTLWQLYTSGTEASFILDEGKKVWDYIVANFAPECLEVRQF
jgi:hypothetical protein